MTDYLYHYGVLGMKWGVRRYRNKDGTLTEEGKLRYLDKEGYLTKEGKKEFFKGEYGKESKAGRKVYNADPEGDIGKAISSESFDRYYWGKFTKNGSGPAMDAFSTGIDRFNTSFLPQWNAKWASKKDNNGLMPKGYYTGLGKEWNRLFSEQLLSDFGEHPKKGKDWVNKALGYGYFDWAWEDELEERRKGGPGIFRE